MSSDNSGLCHSNTLPSWLGSVGGCTWSDPPQTTPPTLVFINLNLVTWTLIVAMAVHVTWMWLKKIFPKKRHIWHHQQTVVYILLHTLSGWWMWVLCIIQWKWIPLPLSPVGSPVMSPGSSLPTPQPITTVGECTYVCIHIHMWDMWDCHCVMC